MNKVEDHDILSDLMNKSEAAKALKCSTRTLDRYHTQRTGPPRFLVGGRIAYVRHDIVTWLEELQQKSILR